MGILSVKDYILLLIIGIWLTLALRFMFKRRKKGQCMGCSHDCTCCQKRKKKN